MELTTKIINGKDGVAERRSLSQPGEGAIVRTEVRENCGCPYTEDGSAYCIEIDGIIECDGSCYHKSADAESQNEERLERQAEERIDSMARSHYKSLSGA